MILKQLDNRNLFCWFRNEIKWQQKQREQ